MTLSRRSLCGWTSGRLDGHTAETIGKMRGMIKARLEVRKGRERL